MTSESFSYSIPVFKPLFIVFENFTGLPFVLLNGSFKRFHSMSFISLSRIWVLFYWIWLTEVHLLVNQSVHHSSFLGRTPYIGWVRRNVYYALSLVRYVTPCLLNCLGVKRSIIRISLKKWWVGQSA